MKQQELQPQFHYEKRFQIVLVFCYLCTDIILIVIHCGKSNTNNPGNIVYQGDVMINYNVQYKNILFAFVSHKNMQFIEYIG